MSNCTRCGEPMPMGEEMFKFHGYSGPCPAPPLPSQEKKIAEAHRTVVPIVTMQTIATAIVKRVAELPNRSSPDDWPQAMLVTGEELRRIIMEEVDAEIG